MQADAGRDLGSRDPISSMKMKIFALWSRTEERAETAA